MVYCHHGSRECRLNEVHACALAELEFPEAFEFIHCMMTGSKTGKLNLSRSVYSYIMCLELFTLKLSQGISQNAIVIVHRAMSLQWIQTTKLLSLDWPLTGIATDQIAGIAPKDRVLHIGRAFLLDRKHRPFGGQNKEVALRIHSHGLRIVQMGDVPEGGSDIRGSKVAVLVDALDRVGPRITVKQDVGSGVKL